MKKIMECVPNFSEGKDSNIIKKITGTIEKVEQVKLLGVEAGKDANRTVVTFAGEPEFVVKAAFRAIGEASRHIDMSKHKGVHPRFGATDVCPLIPVKNISMRETVEFTRKLAERVGNELGIPVFCYEYAALKEERKSLSNCRSGGYEKLRERISTERWHPDFGPHQWSTKVAKSGATAIGARNFLVAYNVNLNTASIDIASAIASEIRESGRVVREGDPVSGKIVRDELGKPQHIPGLLKKTKAIGWYIEEYGISQVSVNLTDLSVTPVHVVFEKISKLAEKYGVKVTGSELVGLIPLNSLLEAGEYFMEKKKLPVETSEDKIIYFAVKSLGLDELTHFNPKKKIIEYVMFGKDNIFSGQKED